MFHWPDHSSDTDDPIDDRVFEIALKNSVRLLVPGEMIESETAVIVRPKPLQWIPDTLHEFSCKSVVVIDDCIGGEEKTKTVKENITHTIESVFGHPPAHQSYASFLGITDVLRDTTDRSPRASMKIFG